MRTYGIVAPWGGGKTSFINLLKSYYKSSDCKNVEVIDFSPWHLPGDASIAESFFNLLSGKLQNFDKTLYKLLRDYAGVLLGKERKGFLEKYISFEEGQQFDDVRKALKECRKRFVVFVDDLDRMEGKEILEVLKLMRGSANFPNLIFVVAYDRGYIVNALKTVSTAMDDDYLKKFFNDEYYLPTYPKDVLRQLAADYAAEFLSPDERQAFKKYIESSRSLIHDSNPIDSFITNPRELKHWLNTINTDFGFLRDDIVLEDVANIALLKLYYPEIYEAIRIEYDTYLTIKDERYQLYKEPEKDKPTLR